MLARFARTTVKASRRNIAAATSRRTMATGAPATGADLPYVSVTEGKHLGVGDEVPNVLFKTRARLAELVEAGEENPYDWSRCRAKRVLTL